MAEEWNIEQLVPGGDGFARRADGRVAFATGALPGDVIRVLEVEEQRGYARAKRWELVRRSAHRVRPPCAVAAECGGCDWMALERGMQLVEKGRLLREALGRTGKLESLPESIPVVSTAEDLGYRSRLRLHIDERGHVGLFARGSHTLIEIPACVVSHPEINRALTTVRQIARRTPLSLGAFDQLEIRVADRGAAVVLHFFPRAERKKLPENLLAELRKQFVVHVEGRAASRDADQRWELTEGVDLVAPAGVFTQVNWGVNRRLVSAVVSGARARNAATFCDLYCGAGNFSLALLAANLTGVAVEKNTVAIEAARRAARDAGLPELTFRSGDVAREVAALVRDQQRFDVAIFDPPRTGAKAIVPALLELAPRFIAAVACDPVTLARDVKDLHAGGYVVDEMVAFDMFPHTHHVESLVWLSAPPSPTV
jgi:23S rRNA (uracil1939-C5)-methyltransferase